MLIGKIWRWRNRKSIAHPMSIWCTRNDCKVTSNAVLQPAFSINHLSQFPNSHPIDHRNLMHSNERLMLHIKDWTVNIPSIWIGSIKKQQGNIIFRTGFHHIMQCRDICIESDSHILYIKQHQVNTLRVAAGESDHAAPSPRFRPRRRAAVRRGRRRRSPHHR